MCYMHRAARVGVRELRQHLSVYLDRVKRGEALVVTEHGAIVAELRPATVGASQLDRLVREGVAVAPRRRISDLAGPVRLAGGRTLSAILQEDRDDRL